MWSRSKITIGQKPSSHVRMRRRDIRCESPEIAGPTRNVMCLANAKTELMIALCHDHSPSYNRRFDLPLPKVGRIRLKASTLSGASARVDVLGYKSASRRVSATQGTPTDGRTVGLDSRDHCQAFLFPISTCFSTVTRSSIFPACFGGAKANRCITSL